MNVTLLDVVPEISKTALIKKNFFFLFRLGGFLYFTFQFSDPCLCIISSTVVSSSVYFTLVIIFF